MLDLLLQKSLVKICEDSLTASVFSQMKYLPKELAWEILRKASYEQILSKYPEEILEIDFWPHWSPEGTDKVNYVEPDVFIRFEMFDLIIEAKRWDSNQQYFNQWRNECIAYLNEYGEELRDVYLLALGGINKEACEYVQVGDKKITVVKCRWTQLLDEIRKIHKSLSLNKGHLSYLDSTINVLSDMITSFSVHGFATGDWLEDLDFETFKLSEEIGLLLSSFTDLSKLNNN